MGNLHSNEIRELFDKLDVNKSGSLSLKEIIESGLPELADTSLLCLFRFDANLDGCIKYHDFVNLIKHLKRLEKEKLLRTKRGGIGYNLRKFLRKKEQKRPTKCWKALDFRKAEEIKSKLTRNSQTPQIVGKDVNDYDSDESSDYYESSDNDSVEEEEEKEGRLFLNKSLREVRGKEKFMNWLFKLADSEKEEKVSLEELGLFLKLIARDHISTSSLTYNDYDIDDNTPEYISKSIMEEFNVGKTGYLRRDEFMVLAELITDYYDELVSNSEERYIKDFRLKWKLGEGASGVVMLAIKESPNPPSTHSNPSLASTSSNSLHEKKINGSNHNNNNNHNHNHNNNNNSNHVNGNHNNSIVHHQHHNGHNHSRSNSGSNLISDSEESSYHLNNNRYAIKIIKKNSINDFSLIDKEIQAMLMIRHPNVVELYEVLEDNENVYFVMELCGGGSIADYITIKPFSEDLSRTYFKQLLLAVHHCHQVGVVHRDLKLENLLLDNEGVLHVSDFGQSGIFQPGWDLFSTATGCVLHISPEQIKGEFYSGEKADTWAIGVALYRMLFACPPFYSSNPQELIENIIHAKFEFPENIKVSQEVKDLICKFLKPDPNDRIDLGEALKHPWLNVDKTYNPSLFKHYISRKCNNTIEELWTNLKTLVKKFEIVPVQVNDVASSDAPTYIHKLKCHYPHKDLKFSITLQKSENSINDNDSDSSFSSLDDGKSALDTKERYFLEFSLWDGESFVFRKLAEKIVRNFEKSLAPKYAPKRRCKKRKH